VLHSSNHCCSENIRMYCVFSLHYLKNNMIFGKNLLKIKSVFWFSQQLLSKIFLILRIKRDIYINLHRSSCKVPILLVRFQSNFNFLDRFSNNPQYQFPRNPSNVSPFVPCGQTDMMKINVTFHNVVNMSKQEWQCIWTEMITLNDTEIRYFNQRNALIMMQEYYWQLQNISLRFTT
jgi:hypothetical protein